jgi:hypothetical protein
MIISTEHAVDFLGSQLTFVQVSDGTTYAPLKRLCESLGIDYEGQKRKVRNNPALNTELISVPGPDGRHRMTLCLAVADVGEWASTIDPNAVPPGVLEKLGGYLEGSDEVSEDSENQGATADPEIAEITGEEDRKEGVYNCLGNLNWFLDAFLLWAREMSDNDGDYFPRDDQIIKASPAEIREYVRKVRCDIRVLQAIIDASTHYENMDNPVDSHGLIELYNEAVRLYRSTDKLIYPSDGDGSGSRKSGHSYGDYLCGPGLNMLAQFGVELYADFQQKIIPRKKEGDRVIELLGAIADRLPKRTGANTDVQAMVGGDRNSEDSEHEISA